MPIAVKDGQRIRIPADLAVAALGCGYTVEPDSTGDEAAHLELATTSSEPAPEEPQSAAAPEAPARKIISLVEGNEEKALEMLTTEDQAEFAREMRRALAAPPCPYEDAFLVPREGPSGPLFSRCSACGRKYTQIAGETCCPECVQRARAQMLAARGS